MHSSVPIGTGNRDSVAVSGMHTVANNYSEFMWCGPNNTTHLLNTDENYNIDGTNNYHRLNDQVSPVANSHSSYYDFHTHHNSHAGAPGSVGALSLNIGNRSVNVNDHHQLGPIVGHHHHHLQPHQHYAQMVETVGSEAEECCSSGSGPGEYYVTAARSPSDSAYEMWNCQNNGTPAHLSHHGMVGDGGTSVGHPSPEDPLLISPNDDDDGNEVVGGISRDANGGLVMTPRATPRRRNTANKKERRRTMSINNAFADLRDCIPNVPADTKLSKIKTLRLATSYIAYLSDVLSGDDPSRTPAAFTAEISRKLARGDEKRKKELLMAELNNSNHHHARSNSSTHEGHSHHHRKTKGRTGWPQHVWALELQQ